MSNTPEQYVYDKKLWMVGETPTSIKPTGKFPVIANQQWKTLEDYLRKPAVSELPQYTAPSSYVLDGDDSCIAVKWTENGESFTNLYNGQNANEFWTFITEFACEIKENSAE